MRGGTLMLCSFLVLLAVESSHGSRSDVRQQLRSEVVYSERNHKEGRYKYGYAVKKGESQFHHQRSLDGAMYGCYGYVDPQGKLFITHYLADMAGYRLVNMANPDRKLAERIRNLGTSENPIDLQHLFPAECQEDGDIKTLQQTADAMKASLAESGDQTTSYRSRSSSQSVSTGSQDTSVRGTVVKNTATETLQTYGLRSVSQKGSSESQDANARGSLDLLKSTATSGVNQVQSNQLQTVQQNQQEIRNRHSQSETIDSQKSNLNKGSNLTKISVGALTTGSEPKFVLKSNTASDSNKSSTFKKTEAEQTVVASSASMKASDTKLGFQVSEKLSKHASEYDETLHSGSTGLSGVKQITGEQQSAGGKAPLKLSGVAEGTTKPLREFVKIAGDHQASTKDSLEISHFNKIAHKTGSVSVIDRNEKTTQQSSIVAYKKITNEKHISGINEGHAMNSTFIKSANLAATKPDGSTKALQADGSKVFDEVIENSGKQITGDLYFDKRTAIVEQEAKSKESEINKVAAKQQPYETSTTFPDAGTRNAESNAVVTKKASQNISSFGTTIEMAESENENFKEQITENGTSKLVVQGAAGRLKSSEESKTKISEKKQTLNNSTKLRYDGTDKVTLKTTKSDSFAENQLNGYTNQRIVEDKQVYVESMKKSDMFSEKLKSAENSASLIKAEESMGQQVAASMAKKDAKIGLLAEAEQANSTGVKILNREFLSVEERTASKDSLDKVSVEQSRTDLPPSKSQAVKTAHLSSEKNNVEGIRAGIDGPSQVSHWSSKVDATISSQSKTRKGSMTTAVKTSEQKESQGMLDPKAMKSTASKEIILSKEVSLAAGSIEQENRDFTEIKRHDVKSEQTLLTKENAGSVRSEITGSSQTMTESKFRVNAVVKSKSDVTTSSPQAIRSAAIVNKSHQKDSEANVDLGTKKSTVVTKAESVSKIDVTSDSKVASQNRNNGQEYSVKLASEISDMSNYEEINLRFDDEEAKLPKKVKSDVEQSFSSAFSASSSTKTNQDSSSGRSSSGAYRGTVKYANYATESKQSTDLSKTKTDAKSTEVRVKNQRSKARVQQETQASLEQNVAKNLRDGSTATSQKGVVTIAEYIKDSASNDASKLQQTESVKQSTDVSTKQEESSVKSSLKSRSEQKYSTSNMSVKISSDQRDAKDRNVNEESSGVKQLTQGSESQNKQTVNESNQLIEISLDQSKAQDKIADKESSSYSSTILAHSSSSGKSFSQAKSEQSSKQVKESSMESTPIIRFAIPGIIQQGPPVQGRRSFVGIPNLNGLFSTNSQSRVGSLSVSEQDEPYLETIQRLPATPRPTSLVTPVTFSYHLPSGTDRVPVTPRPTTGVRPITPGFPATTVKSLISKTTVGPSGDIYDEIEEELNLGSQPTLMSPQIQEQKPPSTSSGGVSVIPSVSQGVIVEQSGFPHCHEVTLQIPADAKQIFVRTDSSAFRVFGDGNPNERIRLVEPGVYEVNLGATSGIQFNQYQADDNDWKRSNKLQLDVDRSFDYGELVQKPLYSRTQSGHHSTTTGVGSFDQARLNNPYLPLVPAAAPVEARNARESAEQALTPEQRSLLSLVPSWKKVLLYY